MWLEAREHIVGERPRIAAFRSPDADAQAKKVLRLQMLRDRAQAVVAGEAAALARLQAAEIEIAFVVDDEDRVGRDLVEPRRSADGASAVAAARRHAAHARRRR